MDDVNFEKIAEATFAKTVWELLQKAYQGANKVRRVRLQALRGEMERYQQNENESVFVYCSRVQAVVNQPK